MKKIYLYFLHVLSSELSADCTKNLDQSVIQLLIGLGDQQAWTHRCFGWESHGGKKVQPSNSHKSLVRLMMRQFCQLKTRNIVESFESLQPWIYCCFITDEGFCARLLCRFHPEVPWSKLGVTLQCVLWPRTLACGSELVSGQQRGICCMYVCMLSMTSYPLASHISLNGLSRWRQKK